MTFNAETHGRSLGPLAPAPFRPRRLSRCGQRSGSRVQPRWGSSCEVKRFSDCLQGLQLAPDVDLHHLKKPPRPETQGLEPTQIRHASVQGLAQSLKPCLLFNVPTASAFIWIEGHRVRLQVARVRVQLLNGTKPAENCNDLPKKVAETKHIQYGNPDTQCALSEQYRTATSLPSGASQHVLAREHRLFAHEIIWISLTLQPHLKRYHCCFRYAVLLNGFHQSIASSSTSTS